MLFRSDKPRKPKNQITLSRRIAVKSIVTDQFRSYLRYELSQTISMGLKRIDEIDEKLKALDKTDPKHALYLEDRARVESELDSARSQEKTIDALKNDDLFSQGSIEGFVSVNIGDNLYDKLGGLEIVVKDGIIKKIQPAQID